MFHALRDLISSRRARKAHRDAFRASLELALALGSLDGDLR